MSLSVSSGNAGSYALVPEGVYIARCYRLIDQGTQTSTGMFGTKSAKTISISWELLDDDVKMEDGRPFAVHKNYSASLHEKATLRKDLEAWRNKRFTEEELADFDLNNVLGTYCQIQVAHSTDGQYANVQSIMAAKFAKDKDGKPIGQPKPVNPDVAFDIDNPDMDVFNALSENMKAKIMAAPEWQAQQKPKEVKKEDVVVEDLSDEESLLQSIPF